MDQSTPDDREMELAQQLNANLHEVSQPLTALLCALEHGASFSSVAELKQSISGALKECNRLREIVHGMQVQVQQALQRERLAAEKYRAKSIFVV